MIAFEFSVSLVLFIALVATYVAMRRQVRRQTDSAEVIVALNGVLQTQVDELQSRSRDFELLGEMSELLQVSTGIAEACDVLSSFGMALFNGLTGAVLITKSTPGMVESIASWAPPSGPQPVTAFATTDCWALRRGQTHIGSVAGIRCLHTGNIGGPTICVPMLALGEGLGVVTLMASGTPVIGAEVERFARSFADQIALAVANLRMQETLRTRAVRDALTGLYNRRYMEESLARELVRASKRKCPAGVLMIDLDHFKRFNDSYGHAGGDALLQQFARLMQNVFREEDVVCRYGGEEFVVVMPDADVDVVRAHAQSLVEAARLMNVHLDGEELGAVTVSAGFALCRDGGASPGALIASADRALYNAKASGRDRVVGPLPQIVGVDAA